MKRGQRNVEARPEAARRRKPCSKIEARLRQRRDKIDKTEETSNFSPRMTRKKRDSERSSRSSITSSSESEISPRFMTSKQHVELVNFESRKFLPVPRFRKLAQNFVKKIEATSVRETLDESRETNKNHCQTVVKNEENEKSSREAIKTLIREEMFESKIQKRNPRNDNFDGKLSQIIDPKIAEEEDASKKRRSRSAPCNPLFKIKCAKDKCPRNLFVERKSLVGEKKVTEEIRACRKNCFRGLRISKSGEVAIASVEEPRMGDGNVDRSKLNISESRRDEFETILMPNNLQAKKLQRGERESSFLPENTKLVQYENIESASNCKHRRSLQREDVESSCNLISRKSLQQQNVESPTNCKHRRSLQREDVESSCNLINRKSLQQQNVESPSNSKHRRSLQREDVESSFNLINRKSLQQKNVESPSNSKHRRSLQREDVESSCNPINRQSLQQQNVESSSNLENRRLIRREDIGSSSNPMHRQSLEEINVESSFLQENTNLLQDEDIESSSQSKNAELLQKENIRSCSNSINMRSLQQKDVRSSFLQENRKLLLYENVESSLQSKNTESLRKEDNESCSNPKNMLSVHQKDVESCALKENIKLLQDEETESSLQSKNTESLRTEDNESCSNPKNVLSAQQNYVESYALKENIKLHPGEDTESSSDPKNTLLLQQTTKSSSHLKNRQSLQQEVIESFATSKNTQPLQQEDTESFATSKNTQSLQQEDIESFATLKNTQSLQQEDTESSSNKKNRPSLQQEVIESLATSKNTQSLQQEDTKSFATSKNTQSLQQEDTESSATSKNTQSLQQEDPESSATSKNTQSLQQEDTESPATSKNTQSLHQEEFESSSHPRNRQQLQQADTGSISLPEEVSKNSENPEKFENREEIEYKEEKNKSHIPLHPNNLNSTRDLPTVKTVEKNQEDANFVGQEGGKEEISLVAESPERRNEPEKRRSPRKPPKKRAFKWETMLEKQHQQSSSRSPENRNESSEIATKNPEENKFDFWTEKDANCSKHCRCPRSRVKALEERRLVAYRAIREELPKILMKRRYLEPSTNPVKKIEAIKTKNWQQNLSNSANRRSSPERPREFVNRNDSRLNQRFVENFAKRWNRRDCSIFADSSEIAQKNSKNIEDSAKRDLEKNLRKQRKEPKKNKAKSDSPLNPRNFEESIGAKKNFGASVLKRRKSPSPRRVTFRLPGRVIEENSIEDEEDDSRNGRDLKNVIAEKCTSDSDNAENEEMGWSEKNYQSEKKTEKNVNFELERGSFVGDKLRKDDEISNSCVEERSRKLRSANTLTVSRMKNLQNMRWPSPSCLAGVEQRDENETDDSEQDWETPTGEDVYRTQEVTYPKETREAMKILMRAKENVSRCKHSDHCQKKIDRREIFRQNEDYLRAEKSPERNATPVSSYANALAKFQEGCYLDSNRSLYGTLSQRRVSRNPNVAGGK